MNEKGIDSLVVEFIVLWEFNLAFRAMNVHASSSIQNSSLQLLEGFFLFSSFNLLKDSSYVSKHELTFSAEEASNDGKSKQRNHS